MLADMLLPELFIALLDILFQHICDAFVECCHFLYSVVQGRKDITDAFYNDYVCRHMSSNTYV